MLGCGTFSYRKYYNFDRSMVSTVVRFCAFLAGRCDVVLGCWYSVFLLAVWFQAIGGWFSLLVVWFHSSLDAQNHAFFLAFGSFLLFDAVFGCRKSSSGQLSSNE